MAVTRSTSAERAQNPRHPIQGRGRALERVLLLLTSALILAAVSLTAAAKMARIDDGSDSERLNLSTLDRREQLLPFLQSISSPAERQYIAGKIFEHIRSGPDSVSHVGEIGQIRVPIHDVLRTHGLTELQARARQVQSARPGAETILLLNSADVARLKPFFVVRDESQFRNQLILWSLLFFCSFWAVHIFWSVISRSIGSRRPAIRVAVCSAAEWRRTDADGHPARPSARHACLLDLCPGRGRWLCGVGSGRHAGLSPHQRKAKLRFSPRQLPALGRTHPLRFRTNRQ